MKHTFQKWLCLLLAMTMVIGLLPAGMFAGAASDTVVLGLNQYLVDDDFASATANETVTAEVAGVTYQGVMGTNAFATISAAVAKSAANAEVYVAAGTYPENVTVSQNISLYGNNKDVNPNNKDWTINNKRTDPENESTIIGLVKVGKTGLTKFVVNGFSFTGAAGIDENLSSGATKGIDVCYNYFHDNINISDSQGVWRFINPATRTGRIAYNRVENNCSAKTLTFRNGDDFTVEGNYIYNTASSQGLWISAETKNGSTDPGLMKMAIKNNYIIAKTYAYYFNLHYATTVDVSIANNYGQATYGVYMLSAEGCTASKNITIEGNEFKGSTADIYFSDSASTCDASLITVKNNKLLSGIFKEDWKIVNGVLDLSYNYFANTAAVTASAKPIVYPRYTDKALTTLQGEMLLEEVNLYGIKSNGTQETLTGVIVDNDAQTITLKENLDAIYDSVRVEAIPQALDSDIAVEYYADFDMTTRLTDGDVVDYLKSGNNLVYIKLTTSLDNFSYKKYTLTIPREASSKAEVLGVNEYEGSVSGTTVAITVPSDVKDANILLNTSVGSTYRLYRDKDLTDMISGTIIYDIPAATSTYYAKVTAEDGTTTKTYMLVVTKAPTSDVSIKSFISPIEAELDEWESTDAIPAYVANFTYDVTSVDVDIEVAEGATWELYEDVTCAKVANKTGIELTDADQTYFIKVTGEKNVASQVYKLILHRDSVDTSKKIIAVTSDALKATVKGNEIYISLASTVTEYKPEFEYMGSEWHIYDEDDNVLSGDMLSSVSAGKHTYYINVYAKDGSYKQYSLTVDRKANTSAVLTTIGGGSEYYVDRFDYVATTKVPAEGVFMPTFVVSDKSVGATVSVQKNGQEVELPLSLRAGTSQYTIVVTAEDGVTTTEYDWTITCVGDGVEALSGAVVLSDEWADCAEGEIVYANVNGKKYKAYYGDTAFSVYAEASTAAATKGKTIYVMPNTVIDEDIVVNGIKLYGANYMMSGVNAARYPESILTGRVILRNATVSGFLLIESAYITIPDDDAVISNNIFVGGDNRTDVAIQADDNLVSNITISGNLFDYVVESDAIHIAEAGDKLLIADNCYTNVVAGSMLAFASLEGEMEISGNTVSGTLATAVASTNGALSGYLYVHDNIVNAGRAVDVNAAYAEQDFAINFNNNNVDTSKVAVLVSNAPVALASTVVANQNTFASVKKSVLIDFVEENTTPVDITENYFGTSAPDSNVFDTSYDYKPYYLDAAKTVLSNTVNMLNITVNGVETVDDGESEFAVVPAGNATVMAEFAPIAGIPADAYGTVYIDGTVGAKNYDVASGNVTVEVKAVSPDGTASQTRQVVLYQQTANPIYNVYDVVNSIISGMDVLVVVEHTTTAWTPKFAVVDNSAVKFYEDEACTKALGNTIALTGDSTVVYAKVAGYPAVTVTAYKKLSYEKAILSLNDAYTFEYTASTTAVATVDNRIAMADMSAVVSDGAVYEVYADAELTNVVDETMVSEDTTLYYKVTAADGTSKVFAVTVTFIEVVDPEIISIENTTTDSSTDNEIVATVNSYDASNGFTIKLNVNEGCTYVLYTDAAHSILCKNNTTFFDSNYVYAYAVVTSPDGVVSADYTIKLVKTAEKVTFVDTVPSWATAAVEYTKDLGIVNGVKVDGGVKLNADGASTRETMACLMVRMLGIDATQYAFVDLSGFEDSSEVSSWALSSVKAAVQLGIFAGAKNGDKYYLNPTDNITREQFAIVFVRAIGAADEDVKSYTLDYKDAAAISSWARTEVKIMTKLGLMQGSYGNFNPKNSVTRAQILQVIYNYMK